jgi:hypothetical protein
LILVWVTALPTQISLVHGEDRARQALGHALAGCCRNIPFV